jgi:hypothetical protein
MGAAEEFSERVEMQLSSRVRPWLMLMSDSKQRATIPTPNAFFPCVLSESLFPNKLLKSPALGFTNVL